MSPRRRTTAGDQPSAASSTPAGAPDANKPNVDPVDGAGLQSLALSGPVRDIAVPDEPLIDIRALASWLSVSESVVRKWTASGPESGLAPKFIRINGQIRFRPADVRDFLSAREVR